MKSPTARLVALALPAALVSILSLSAPSAIAADEPNYAAILEQKAPTVVTVKYVLKVRMSMGGQSGDEEQNADARGVVVDPSGLVMVSSDAFEAGGGMFRRMRGPRGQGIDASATPTQLKIVFGNEEKEHEAVLAATEKKLGLAFVQIVAPEGTPAAVDLGKGADPKLGQWLVGVTRQGRGFDSAPVFSRAIVTGRVEKPRVMWAIDGGRVPGLPLFNADGQAVGVVSMQQGVEGADEGGRGGGGFMSAMGGGGANSGTFLLPLDVVSKAKDAAKKKAEEAVAKAKEAKEKDAKEAKDAADSPKPADSAMDGAAPTTPSIPATPDKPKAPDQPK